MNKQSRPNDPFGGISYLHLYGPNTGYTWNVAQGCLHDCKWCMPGGQIAECYAKNVAKIFKSDKFFPDGFDTSYWHPERLSEPLKLKKPAGIFLDSMSDLMGMWVSDEHIQEVLDVCKQASWHTFFLLTKNAPRLLKFTFPQNVWVGVSSPPDYFMGKQLSEVQKRAMLDVALGVLPKVKGASVTWCSFEPLAMDVAPIVAEHPASLLWAVIGAASYGKKYYQPEDGYIDRLEKVLDLFQVPIYHKDNLVRNPRRTEYPGV